MVDQKTFSTMGDYEVPLLRLLCDLEDGQGVAQEVMDLFESTYAHLIPSDHRELTTWSHEPLWKDRLRRCRQRLKERAFLAESRPGTWQISQAGRDWVKANPAATHIGRLRRPRRKRTPSRRSSLPGITLEMLEQTRKVMSADQFRSVWGTHYDQLLAEERAQAITSVSQTELGRRTRQRLDEIHAFLRGENTGTPSSETVCDWIHFCYALQLYREAAALLQYAREDEVDPAIYKRAKRIAEVCRSKLAG